MSVISCICDPSILNQCFVIVVLKVQYVKCGILSYSKKTKYGAAYHHNNRKLLLMVAGFNQLAQLAVQLVGQRSVSVAVSTGALAVDWPGLAG